MPIMALPPSRPPRPKTAFPRRSAQPNLPPNDVEPAVLFVGAEQAFSEAVAKALERHKVFLERATIEEAVEMAIVAAPDLVVLTGAAALDGGRALLRQMAARPESSVVPVAIIQEDTALDARLRAFRHGAAAILPQKASVDELARKIAQLAREIPARSNESLGEVGEATLEELVQTLGDQVRSGILSVLGGPGDQAIRLVLGEGRPLAELIEDFVDKTRKHVVSAEPLRYEFESRASGTVQLFDPSSAHHDVPTEHELQGLRVVLADDDSSRADSVASDLRRHGADVVVSALDPVDLRFQRMRQADPAVLVVGEEHIEGPGYGLVRRMQGDMRLRWAFLAVVRWDEIWGDDSESSLEKLAATLRGLTEPERNLATQAASGEAFDARLEVVGPARTLRALSTSPRGLRVTVSNPRLWAELDLANGLLVGALAKTLRDDERELEGAEALAALLQLSSGRIQVDPVDHPARANLMATIDMALDIAAGEKPPIEPSLPAGPPSSHPSAAEAPRVPRVPRPPAAPRAEELGFAQTMLGGPPSSPPKLDRRRSSVSVPSAEPRRKVSVPSAPVATPVSPGVADLSARVVTRETSERAETTATSAPAVARSVPHDSPVDQRLRRLLQVDERGLSPSMIAVLAALSLVQLLWVVVLIMSASPRDSAEIKPAPTVSAPLAQGSSQPGVHAGSRKGSEEVEAEVSASAEPQPPLPDGSGTKAPSCEEVIGDASPERGSYPGAAHEFAGQGIRALRVGQVEVALDRYCKATAWDRENPSHWLLLAQVYMLKRDGDRALPAVEKAFSLNPDDAPTMQVLADALARVGNAERAREFWEKSSSSPGDPRILDKMADRDAREGERAERRKDWVYAERMYRRVALMQPERARGAVGLGRTLLALREVEAAERWADYAVAVEGGNASSWVMRGDVLAKQNKPNEAHAAWKRALELDPAHPEALERLR